MNIRDVLHRSEMPGWEVLKEAYDGLHWMMNVHHKKFSVIASVLKYSDGKHWVHVSFSLKDRMPNYDDTAYFKRWIIGHDKKISPHMIIARRFPSSWK